MKNVYEEVRFFYKEKQSFNSVVRQAWTEKFLQKKAWVGNSDEELRSMWHQLKYFYCYLENAGFRGINELSSADYIKAMFYLKENLSLSEDVVHHIFSVLRSFYEYLDTVNDTLYTDELFLGLKDFYMEDFCPTPKFLDIPDELYDQLDHTDGITREDAEQLNVLLETLLNKIGLYYKGDEFSLDFNRALALYAGPLNVIPEDESEEFWLGFWDYFLFDYHLIKSDLSPLKYFYNKNKKFLQSTELRILKDLMKAEFTVFYINYVRDDDLVECTNLFTNKKIQLPQPDFGLCDYRKVLLYGHIYLKGVVMLNYITSVSVSINLRKRIKEEVFRQHQIYKYQEKSASLNDFFKRHAIVVRHTIDILVRLAKVNVVSPDLLLPFEDIDVSADVKDENAESVLKFLADRYHFSLYASTRLFKLWKHVCAVLPPSASPESRALSVFLSFTTINGVNFINKKLLLARLGVKKEDFQNECEKIAEILKLRIFDPRYLTEEGFVLSLYAF